MEIKYVFDIAFVGGGLSSTATLINLVLNLIENKYADKLNILIFEKSNSIFKGFVYGEENSADALIITPLNKFIFNNDYIAFESWLQNNFETLIEKYKKINPIGFDRWFKNNEVKLNKKRFQDIFFPRFFYGDYLEQRALEVISLGKREFDLNISYYKNTNVINIKKEVDFKITTSSGDFFTEKIVLGIGSPKIFSLNQIVKAKDPNIVVDNIHHPFVKENVENIILRISKCKDKHKRNILIVGSNATSLEILYFVYTYEKFRANVNKLYVISGSGKFPYLLKNFEEKYTKEYTVLKEFVGEPTAFQLLQNIKKELDFIQEDVRSLYFENLMDEAIKIFNTFSDAEKKKFVFKYGLDIVKEIRRVGEEYYESILEFTVSNKLEILKGSLEALEEQLDGSFLLTYKNNDLQENRISKKISVTSIINARGFESIESPSSELLQNLLKNKLVSLNASKKGFELDEHFQSIQCANLFVMGPLLAGYYSENLRLWHVESNSRILQLSKILGNVISNTFIKKMSIV